MDSEKPSWKAQALPIAVGAAISIVVLLFLFDHEPPPRSRPTGEPAAPAPPAASSEPKTAISTPPLAATSAPASTSAAASTGTLPPAATSPPAAPQPPSPPVPGERTRHVVWDAMARHRTPNAVSGGIACSLEATLAGPMEGPLTARTLLLSCGGKALYELSTLPSSAVLAVSERPSMEQGSFAYTLIYRDDRAEIDTLHGRATIDVTAPVIGSAFLLVANESRPIKAPFVTTTPDARSLPGAERDRLSGTVTSATGDTLVAPTTKCILAMEPHGPEDGSGRCDVLVQCGSVTVIGAPEPFSARCTRRASRIVAAVDGEAEPADDDPGLVVDDRSAKIWNGGNGARWLVTLALDPAKAP